MAQQNAATTLLQPAADTPIGNTTHRSSGQYRRSTHQTYKSIHYT